MMPIPVNRITSKRKIKLLKILKKSLRAIIPTDCWLWTLSSQDNNTNRDLSSAAVFSSSLARYNWPMWDHKRIKKKSEKNVTIDSEMFLKQCKCVNRPISISRMKFYADINKDNSSNLRVFFFVHLCLWLQNEQRQFCEKLAPHPGGTNDNDAHSCEPNYIKVQNKLSQKYCLWINLQL